MYYDPTKMKVFDTNNWILFDVVYGTPCFQMYNFAQPTTNKQVHEICLTKLKKLIIFYFMPK